MFAASMDRINLPQKPNFNYAYYNYNLIRPVKCQINNIIAIGKMKESEKKLS